MNLLPRALVCLGGILLGVGAFAPLLRFDLLELVRGVPGLGWLLDNPPPLTLADTPLGWAVLALGVGAIAMALLPSLTRWAWVLGGLALALVGYRIYQLWADGNQAHSQLKALLAHLPQPLTERLLSGLQGLSGVVRLEYGWALLMGGGVLVIVGALGSRRVRGS